jgi:tRNA pseudouridine38-40 synthase
MQSSSDSLRPCSQHFDPSLAEAAMKLALGIEYDGQAFHGFQRQTNAPSVQEALETALSRIATQPVRVVAAGRTDAGVHATGQVVSFESAVERPLNAWFRGTNALTPAAVKVIWVRAVDGGFNARRSAVARRYQYLYHETPAPSPLLQGQAVQVPSLDEAAMHRAAQVLVGEHDFTSFRAAACQSHTAYRCIHRISVQRAGPFVVLDVAANAFLLHMVRNIAGALLQVGQGREEESWISRLLLARNRALAGRTAAPQGLYLVDVRYPGYDFPTGLPAAPLRGLGGLDRF